MIEPIDVDLNRIDFIRFSRYCYKNNYFASKKSRRLQLVGIFVVMTLAFMWAINNAYLTIPILISVFLIATVLFIFLAMQITQTFNNAIPDEDSFLFAKRTYHLDESGIHETSTYGSSLIKWEAIRYIRTDGDLLYLFLDRVYAVIIPARSFKSNQDSQHFLEIVRNHAVNLKN